MHVVGLEEVVDGSGLFDARLRNVEVVLDLFQGNAGNLDAGLM